MRCQWSGNWCLVQGKDKCDLSPSQQPVSYNQTWMTENLHSLITGLKVFQHIVV